MGWAMLPLGMPSECASQDCGGAAGWEFEAGGVASNYCQKCKDKIDAQFKRQIDYAMWVDQTRYRLLRKW